MIHTNVVLSSYLFASQSVKSVCVGVRAQKLNKKLHCRTEHSASGVLI